MNKRKQTKQEKEIQNSPVWQEILKTEQEHGDNFDTEFSFDNFETN
jgi:hypothetical protein